MTDQPDRDTDQSDDNPVRSDDFTDRSDDDRAGTRAQLLPEEVAAGGSADPQAQAAAILEDSDRRTAEPERTKAESVQTPD